jgi:glycosyltransferase involved in cell wall biosynthesis
MPRIAIILGRLVIGGTTMDTLQAARYLQHDYEVLLITGGGDKDEFEASYLTSHLPLVKHERVEGFSSKIDPVRDWKAYLLIKKLLVKFQPDIVHTHTAKAGLLGRLAAFNAKVPVIVHTYHGMLFHGYYSRKISWLIIKIERWLARKTTCIIALSAIQKQQLITDFKIAGEDKIQIVALGIEIEHFIHKKAEKRSIFRNQYFVTDNEVAIGIVGRIVPIKNHFFFLQVALKLLQKNLPVRFFIIGDGILRKKLQQETSRLGINYSYFPENPVRADLIYTSWITEIEIAIDGLDIIALTSFNEGTPVSLMEAQAAGKPVVATKAGGIDDILIHGKSGFSVPQGEVGTFADYLKNLVTNANLRQQTGEAGEMLAKQQFQKQRQVSDLKKLYQQLITDAQNNA